MLKFLAEKDGRPMLGLGLSRGNCKKLLDGKPIFIDLKVMMADVSPVPDLSEATVLIFGGENEATMQQELSALMGKLPSPRIHTSEN
jgi:hypothetical protein